MNQTFKSIKYLSILIFVVFLLAVITYIINPNLSETLDSVSQGIPNSVSHQNGLNLVFAYIFNNGFKIPIAMLILSIIPIRFLYWVYPALTAILPGIAFGIVFRYSLAKGLIILISSLPHMLVELLAFCFWMIALDNFNRWIRYKLSKKKITETKILTELRILLAYYIKYVIPLIVVAALIETYVADWISHFFS